MGLVHLGDWGRWLTHDKFTFQKSFTEIAFLDVLVKRVCNDLSTSVYYKPTDTHMYLNYNSFHPKSIKHSIVFSQCLRIKRICSDPIDFDKQISQLTGYFLSAGYPLPVIRKQINRARKRSRSELLEYRIKTPSSRIPFVTSYHPTIKRLIGILKKDFEFLKEDNSLVTILLTSLPF